MAADSACSEKQTAPDAAAQEWALRLFERSPLKQQKFEHITAVMGTVTDKTCLDIGSDNGVVSLLLRRCGGDWHSADLIPETVEAIRTLVGENVVQIDGRSTPFAADYFDLVVIVDFLEHIETDREFIDELYRVLKPEGALVVHVPNPRPGLLRWFKARIGQTDAAHGHVRPGYSIAALERLLHGRFEITGQRSYMRVFSELVDTGITFALDVLKRGGRGQKGTVVTGSDMRRLQKSFRLYSLLYPLIALFVGLDRCCPFLHGNMLVVSARSSKTDQAA